MSAPVGSIEWLRDIATQVRAAALAGAPIPESLQPDRIRFRQMMGWYHRAAQHVVAVYYGLPICWRRLGDQDLQPQFAVDRVSEADRMACAEDVIGAYLAGPHAQRRVLGLRTPLPVYTPEYDMAAAYVARVVPGIDDEAAGYLCVSAERRLSHLLSRRWDLVRELALARIGSSDGLSFPEATQAVMASLSARACSAVAARRDRYA
jgi:hypothetical protein